MHEQRRGIVRVDRFLELHRRLLVGVLVAILGGLGLSAGCLLVMTRLRARASAEVTRIAREWDVLRKPDNTVSASGHEVEGRGGSSIHAKEDALLARLESCASSPWRDGFAYAYAQACVADIFFARKEWEKAQQAYVRAAYGARRSYVAGVYYFNAASCADERGRFEEARELYQRSARVQDFPLVPRALFNVGRMEEALGRAAAATAAYMQLYERFPLNGWAALGKSRAIAISVGGGRAQ